jgi:hypothetical protein
MHREWWRIVQLIRPNEESPYGLLEPGAHTSVQADDPRERRHPGDKQVGVRRCDESNGRRELNLMFGPDLRRRCEPGPFVEIGPGLRRCSFR